MRKTEGDYRVFDSLNKDAVRKAISELAKWANQWLAKDLSAKVTWLQSSSPSPYKGEGMNTQLTVIVEYNDPK